MKVMCVVRRIVLTYGASEHGCSVSAGQHLTREEVYDVPTYPLRPSPHDDELSPDAGRAHGAAVLGHWSRSSVLVCTTTTTRNPEL